MEKSTDNRKDELEKRFRIPKDEELKYEVAEELGLLDKVIEKGWKSLTAKETGKIGGIVASRRKK